MVGVVRKDTHGSEVTFTLHVTAHAILITTLLLAHLAIPSKLLKAFRLQTTSIVSNGDAGIL